MNNTKKSTISGAALAVVLFGAGPVCAWADELAQAPPSPPPPAVAPPAAAAAPAPAAPTSPLIGPSITGPLTIQLPPPKYTLPLLGNIYVDGVASGLGMWQSNPAPGNRSWQPDLSNGQVFVQKTDGLFQFFVEAGAYSLATLGSPYISASQATFGANSPAGRLWGWVPAAYGKIVPTDNFSVQGGRLPTLIGAEYGFSFQNINIERGLLFNQEPTFSTGGQANYTVGPLALSLSFNDGFDSGVYNWVTGSATYTINSTNTFEFAAGGNVGKTNIATLRAPLLQSNSQIWNLIYTYNSDPWIIQPYIQVTHVPTDVSIGINSDASTFGGAILGNYDFGSGFNLGGRLEYIGTTGSNNLLYGPGSAAFSATITPTYQWQYFFARAEVSFVKAHVTPGSGLGPNFNGDTQTRIMVESGILF